MSDDEIVKRLQEQVDNENPMHLDFGDQPGPFELPICGPSVSALVVDEDMFVLELETATHSQRLLIPISTQALEQLEIVISHLRHNYGLDQTKN